MLEFIKKILRISTIEFDEEISQLIASASSDLILSGVRVEMVNDNDPLIRRAISVYCKAHFGFDNKDYENLVNAYNSLKSHLILSRDYGTVV